MFPKKDEFSLSSLLQCLPTGSQSQAQLQLMSPLHGSWVGFVPGNSLDAPGARLCVGKGDLNSQERTGAFQSLLVQP